MKAFGVVLDYYMFLRVMTNTELANKAGINRATLRKILQGKMKFSMRIMFALIYAVEEESEFFLRMVYNLMQTYREKRGEEQEKGCCNTENSGFYYS